MEEAQRQRDRLELWQAQCSRARTGHLNGQRAWSHVDFALTTFNVISSVALLALSGISSVTPLWRGGIAVFGAVAAITSILQYVLDPKERAARHQRATNGYLFLTRDLQELIHGGKGDASSLALSGIRARRDRLSEESPVLPEWSYKRLPINFRIRELEEKMGQRSL